MSKFKNVDLVMYRLDMIEKRIEHLEALLHSKSGQGTSSEVLHLLVDMIKQQNNSVKQQHIPTSTSQKDMPDEENKTPEQTKESFDLACMGRRRTMV